MKHREHFSYEEMLGIAPLAGAKLPPLFRYFGSKCRSAYRYPPPEHNTIIEPFAGGAGYSLLYADRNVILVEKNPIVARCWEWLLQAAPEEIRSLPVHEPGELIPDFVRGPARDWIGFWNAISVTKPQDRMVPSASVVRSSFWSTEVRDRSAETVKRIRHWRIIQGDYRLAPDIEATWFIDPPYQKAGVLYAESSKSIDYQALGEWCRDRLGQVLVCENEGADWLPFIPYADLHAAPRGAAGARRTLEALWYRSGRANT